MSEVSTVKQSDVVSFQAFTTLKGKGIAPIQKAKHLARQGVDLAALAAVGISKKAIHAEQDADALGEVIWALAHGDIRPAAILVTAKSGRAVSIMEVNGKAPFPEFLRLKASLEALPQLNKAGKETPAAKALALWNFLKAGSDKLRAEEAALKAVKAIETEKA